jgi:hypothetical protein
MPAPTLTLREQNRATLARQMLLAREKTKALAAIERLVGLQAQWPRPPFLALWSRIEGFQREELTGLLQRREVVRATLMRCTLHLMSATDYVSLRPAIEPVLDRAMRSVLRERADGFDLEELIKEARAHFGQEPRSFTELRAHLLSLHPNGDERAMGYAIRTQLPLVQVPTEATWGYPATADFALAEEWLGKKLGGSDATPHALVLRYLAALGPATVSDAQAWTGLQGLREAFDALRPKLSVFKGERGKELFDLPDAPRPPEDVAAPARFLPEFDNLIVSRTDARFLAAHHRSSVFLSALRVLPTFLVDGFVAGTWKLDRAKSSAALVIEPFAALSRKACEELAGEGNKLLRFAEADAGSFEVRFAKPTSS